MFGPTAGITGELFLRNLYVSCLLYDGHLCANISWARVLPLFVHHQRIGHEVVQGLFLLGEGGHDEADAQD